MTLNCCKRLSLVSLWVLAGVLRTGLDETYEMCPIRIRELVFHFHLLKEEINRISRFLTVQKITSNTFAP
jgi:hypothetical protein